MVFALILSSLFGQQPDELPATQVAEKAKEVAREAVSEADKANSQSWIAIGASATSVFLAGLFAWVKNRTDNKRKNDEDIATIRREEITAGKELSRLEHERNMARDKLEFDRRLSDAEKGVKDCEEDRHALKEENKIIKANIAECEEKHDTVTRLLLEKQVFTSDDVKEVKNGSKSKERLPKEEGK